MKKKVVAVILSALIALCVGLTMVGCSSYGGHFFDKERLDSAGIPDLPKPKGKVTHDEGSWYHFTIDEQEFENYANEVYSYLQSCEFNKLGGAKSMPSGLHPGQYCECEELNDYRKPITESNEDGEFTTIGFRYVFVWQIKEPAETTVIGRNHYLEISYFYSKYNAKLELDIAIAGFSIPEENKS